MQAARQLVTRRTGAGSSSTPSSTACRAAYAVNTRSAYRPDWSADSPPELPYLSQRPHSVHMMGSHSGVRTGNRYDDPMVSYDVSEKTPGSLLVARLHVDLCRLASAIC
jgi:hypothetical protein